MIEKLIFMAHALPTATVRTCEETNGMLYCFSQWAYTVTNGTFWVLMLLAFCFALFMASYRLGNARAFGFASFVGLIGSVWFAIAGLVAWAWVSVFILVGAIGIVVLIMNER